MCILFNIFNKTNSIYLDALSKCAYSGSDILEKLDRIGKSLGIDYIKLADASHIRDDECKEYDSPTIELSLLNLLANGESWYNSKGYFSKNAKKEREQLNETLQYPFFDFFRNCIEVNRKKRINYPSLVIKELTDNLGRFNALLYKIFDQEGINQEDIIIIKDKIKDIQQKIKQNKDRISEINREQDKIGEYVKTGIDRFLVNPDVDFAELQTSLYPDVNFDNITVHDFFKIIKQKLNELKDIRDSRADVKEYKCEMHKWIGKILNIIDANINYDVGLFKYLTNSRGGKSKKYTKYKKVKKG